MVSRKITVRLPDAVWAALERERDRTGDDVSRLVARAVAADLGTERHSLFQVSTTGALVEGVLSGATTVGDLLHHGDFGLGTFAGLDGELIILDGRSFSATAGGELAPAPDDAEVPFAVVTRFTPDLRFPIEQVSGMSGLASAIDAMRPSENVFVGVRIDGVAQGLAMRAVCPARPGEGLVEAVAHQSEFTAASAEGTFIGFWTPAYARAINVPGYHFHFVNADATLGGHVLDVGGLSGDVSLHVETAVHVAIPQTREFLEADLAADPSAAMEIAESPQE